MSTNKTFLALVGLVTLAFAWVLWPLFGALFWGLTLAIVFARSPLFKNRAGSLCPAEILRYISRPLTRKLPRPKAVKR